MWHIPYEISPPFQVFCSVLCLDDSGSHTVVCMCSVFVVAFIFCILYKSLDELNENSFVVAVCEPLIIVVKKFFISFSRFSLEYK